MTKNSRTGDDKMRKYGNYAIALLVFAVLMAVMNGSAMLLTLMASVAGTVIDGDNGAVRTYRFLLDNLNLYSMLVYLIAAVPVILWYYFAFVEKQGMKTFWSDQTARIRPISILWAALLTFAISHVVSILMAVIGLLLPSAMDNYTELMETSGFTQYSLVWVLSTLILPPVVEETVFRGLIYRYLRKAGACFIVANLIQAVLFGIYHMNLVQGIYAALLGFMLGWLTHRYKSLLIPMSVHAFFNLFGTALADFESRFFPDLLNGLIVLICVPLLAFSVIMIYFRVGEQKRN